MQFVWFLGGNPQIRKIVWSGFVICGLYVAMSLLPSVLYHFDSPYVASVRFVSGMICHQKPSKCFWLYNYPCGLCVKCLGFYIGSLFSLGLYLVSCSIAGVLLMFILSTALVFVVFDSAFDLFAGGYEYRLYVNFVLSLFGGVGSVGLFIRKLYLGGRLVRWFVDKFYFVLAVFVVVNLYGFSLAFGDAEISSEPDKKTVVIPAGTGVVLSVIGDISTKYYREGDSIPLQVAAPVKVKDILVIRSGTPARGLISLARSASSWGGAGELILEAKSVQSIDGAEIPVAGTTSRRGDTSHGASAAVAVGTGVLCLPLALTGAAVKGEEGRVMPGYELVARTINDQTINIPSESERVAIQKQQDDVAQQQKSNAESRAQKQREEENKKKNNSSSAKD